RFISRLRRLLMPRNRKLNLSNPQTLINLEIMPRQQLLHTFNNRERRRNRSSRKIGINTFTAEPPWHETTREQRPQLRRKHQHVFRDVVVKRLDTKRISRE